MALLIDIHFSDRMPGYGRLAGMYNPDPEGVDGIVTVLDAPSGGDTIDCLERETVNWVRRTISRADGTYVLHAVPLGVEHDLIARHKVREYMDVIMGGNLPSRFPMWKAGAPPPLVVGEPYEYRYRIDYGVPPFTWHVDGSLPAGVNFDDGYILTDGATGAAGDYPITITVTDADENTITRTDTITLLPP